jgi:hypothetical protein
MFVDVTSEEYKCKEKILLNKSETEAVSTVSVVQLTITTEGASSRSNPSGNVPPTGHIVDVTAHVTGLCAVPCISGLTLQSHEREHTFISVFLFCFQTLMLFHFKLFLFFYSYSFFPLRRPPGLPS